MAFSDALLPAACAGISGLALWAAWGLASGQPFWAACAVFTAAFWGSLAGCAVWAALSARFRDDDGLPPASVIYPTRRP